MTTRPLGTRRLHPHRAFWVIAATTVMVLFSSSAPSPLYPLYQEAWGFSAFTLTVVFAVYVVTMLVLAAGVLVEYAPAPRSLVYVVILSAYLLLLLALPLVPETSAKVGFHSRRHVAATLAPQASVPKHMRSTFMASMPAFVATWSLGGLFLSLGSSVVAVVFGVDSPAVGGALLFVFFASSAVTSVLITRLDADAKLALGYPLLILGASVALCGVVAELLPVYLAGSVLAGCGFAGCFLGGLDTLTRAAPPAQRGQVFSAVFIASYVAFSVPAVVAGIAVTEFGLRPTVIAYVAYVLILGVVGGTMSARGRRNAPRAGAPEIGTTEIGTIEVGSADDTRDERVDAHR